MIDLLRKRRSIRKYLARKIDSDKIELLKEALLRSPSSRNFQPWHFIFVDENELIKRLAESKPHGSAFLMNAPLVVVILGDETSSDVWIEDCSIAITLLQLTAESLGLGSCWVQIRNRSYNNEMSSEEYIRSIFDLPENIRVEALIGLGYPGEEKTAVSYDQLNQAKINWNEWK